MRHLFFVNPPQDGRSSTANADIKPEDAALPAKPKLAAIFAVSWKRTRQSGLDNQWRRTSAIRRFQSGCFPAWKPPFRFQASRSVVRHLNVATWW
jgi:hypothetical protein